MLPLVADPHAWASLATLTALEIVLGVDNIIFLSIAIAPLTPVRRTSARRIGLSLALVMRIALLTGIVWIVSLSKPVVTVWGLALSWRDLIFAWDIVRHVKSNGVAVVRDVVSRGICAGQTNRVSAVRIAGERAGQYAQGAACASDGFFPFPDGLIAAVDAGCTSVIAPGGSIRDAEVIAAADERDIALVFSNYRYFLH